MKINSNFKRDTNSDIVSAFNLGDEKGLQRSAELPKDYFESLTEKVKFKKSYYF